MHNVRALLCFVMVYHSLAYYILMWYFTWRPWNHKTPWNRKIVSASEATQQHMGKYITKCDYL